MPGPAPAASNKKPATPGVALKIFKFENNMQTPVGKEITKIEERVKKPHPGPRPMTLARESR